jgi:hypothetical protein
MMARMIAEARAAATAVTGQWEIEAHLDFVWQVMLRLPG